jgi:hypothetical protein
LTFDQSSQLETDVYFVTKKSIIDYISQYYFRQTLIHCVYTVESTMTPMAFAKSSNEQKIDSRVRNGGASKTPKTSLPLNGMINFLIGARGGQKFALAALNSIISTHRHVLGTSPCLDTRTIIPWLGGRSCLAVCRRPKE